MKAIGITAPGGPENLRLEDAADPVPAAGEVVIQVAAAGLNRADVLQRQGNYPVPPGASPHPGLEVSGHIAALGPEVQGLEIGQEVVALLAGGGYAEQVLVPAGQVLPVPDGVDLVTAAALPETAATVYSNLFMEAGVQPGDFVLIHGAAGGIGTMAIQMVAAFGAVPMVTAGSAEKLALAAELGAETLINYREEDFVEVVRQATGGHGADAILDVVGAKYLQRNLKALAVGGRLVVIGLQGGTRAELDLNALMRKRAGIIGTTLRSRPVEEKTDIMQGLLQRVWPLVEAGQIRPLVDRTFPLAEAAAAHEYFDSGEHKGKILLTV